MPSSFMEFRLIELILFNKPCTALTLVSTPEYKVRLALVSIMVNIKSSLENTCV